MDLLIRCVPIAQWIDMDLLIRQFSQILFNKYFTILACNFPKRVLTD